MKTKLLEEENLETINYNELNFFAPTNINDADTIFINNSVIGEVQRLTWSKLKSNITVSVIPNYTIKVNNSNFEFNSSDVLDLSPAFNSFVKVDGSTLMLPSYLPTQNKHVSTKDYVDTRTAYTFQYKGGETIGGYLDEIPIMLTAYLLADGTRSLPSDYTPIQNKQIVTKDYADAVTAGFLKIDGTVAMSGPLNMGSNTIINLTNPVNEQDGATKNYVDTQTALDLKRDGSNSPTANIPMNNFKLTGLAAGTANGQSLRYDEFATSPKVRNKVEPNYTELNIVVSTNSASPTTLTTGLADATPLFVGGKLQPLNQPTLFNIQITLSGTFTVGPAQSSTILTLAALAGSSVKPLGKYYLGTADGSLNVYSYFAYEVDEGGNVFTNGATVRAYVDNGTATITGISFVISQYSI